MAGKDKPIVKNGLNKVGSDPQFNSGIAYSELMHDLKSRVHNSAINQQFTRMYLCISSYQTEVLMRADLEQQKRCKGKQHPCRQTFMVSLQGWDKVQYSFKNYEDLMNWFYEVNLVSHELGLVMPDAPDSIDAVGL